MSYLTLEPSFEQVTLERMRIGAKTRVGQYVLENMTLETWTDHATRDLVLGLRSEVLAQRLDTRTVDQRVEWDAPASWWQMFKATYALSWWLSWLVSRRPVRYTTHHKFTTIKFGVEAIYPDATVRLPEDTFGRPFVVNRVLS